MAPKPGQTHTRGKERLVEFLKKYPEATAKEMREETGLSESYIGRFRKEQGLTKNKGNNPQGNNQYKKE